SVSGAALRARSFDRELLLRMNELTPMKRQILMERHLVSHELSDDVRPHGILIGADQRLSLMINKKNHLRLQSMSTGFQLAEAWSLANDADDELEQGLDYAFSEEIGYLTSCPTNAKTGLHTSVLIHLPALVLLEEIQRVLKSVTQIGL